MHYKLLNFNSFLRDFKTRFVTNLNGKIKYCKTFFIRKSIVLMKLLDAK